MAVIDGLVDGLTAALATEAREQERLLDAQEKRKVAVQIEAHAHTAYQNAQQATYDALALLRGHVGGGNVVKDLRREVMS